MTFKLTILGSGAAMPSVRKHTSAHVLNVREQFFLIDCGEGTQRQMMKMGVSPLKINHIFISHLHGDHVFGVFGLMATLGNMGRRAALHIYTPKPFGEVLESHFKYFDTPPYPIEWHEVDSRSHKLLFENRVLEVWSIPLRHRIACAGFMFREKCPPKNIKREVIERYQPGIAQCHALKMGHNVTLDDGTVLENAEATYTPFEPRSYAYISDTQYSAKAASLVEGVNVLYHEATFMEPDRALAKQTGHSTAHQAGKIAKLAKAKRLIIGHFSSRYKDDNEVVAEAAAIFANTSAAVEGQSYPISKVTNDVR